MHFFIGLGALVSPLVADPFLDDSNCALSANWTTNSSHLLGSTSSDITVLPYASEYPAHTEGIVITRVSYAFWIMALINVSSHAMLNGISKLYLIVTVLID